MEAQQITQPISSSKQNIMAKLEARGLDQPTKRQKKSPVTPKLSLKSLPPLILKLIFEYVPACDLCKVASLGKAFYLPAIKRIYRNITLVSNYDLRSAVEDLRMFWLAKYGTFLQSKKVKNFMVTVEKKKYLRDLINSLTIYSYTNKPPMRKLLSVIPVLSFHAETGSTQTTAWRKLAFAQKLTVLPEDFPRVVFCPQEFRLLEDNDSSGPAQYRHMVQSMILFKSHQCLEKLQFSPACDPQDENLPSDIEANWPVFFAEVEKEGLKLGLSCLGLHGAILRLEIKLLVNALDLDKLRTLHLNNVVFKHASGPGVTFLEAITKHTPSLQCLAFYQALGEVEPKVDAIRNTLVQNIPNQLKELSIVCPLAEKEHVLARQTIREAILSSQKNLRKLTLDEGYWFEIADAETLVRVLRTAKSVQFYCERESLRQRYFPQILGDLFSMPCIGYLADLGIRNLKKDIQACLMNDLIYTSAKECLPFLVQYYTSGFFVDIKQDGLFVQHETITFAAQKDCGCMVSRNPRLPFNYIHE